MKRAALGRMAAVTPVTVRYMCPNTRNCQMCCYTSAKLHNYTYRQTCQLSILSLLVIVRYKNTGIILKVLCMSV